jgi:hypothetical protein
MLAAMCCMMAQAVEYYGIQFGAVKVSSENKDDIFGNGKAAFDPHSNTLFLEEGVSYALSKGWVTIETDRPDFTIRVEGNAEIKAAVRCNVPVSVISDGFYTLRITSNISGSALQCGGLYVGPKVTLNLLSRNSQRDMYALDCRGRLEIVGGTLLAEVTTADMAVMADELVMERCVIEKPKGATLNKARGGICFGDGAPAKIVRIVPKKPQDQSAKPRRGR